MSDDPPILDHPDGAQINRAFRAHGGCLYLDRTLARATPAVLAAARAFFDLPLAAKQGLSITRSEHFRGWSEMQNERDWREQIHFGRERAPADREPIYLGLEGPNLWPADPQFRSTLSTYMDHVATLGAKLLVTLMQSLGETISELALVEQGYRLLKLIQYYGQREPHTVRPGVAAHVDFSFVTLTLQDDRGLAVRRPDGRWMDVPVVPGALWVHVGELLQVVTRGRFGATPHRVINPAVDHTRISLPFFLNPPLDQVVKPLARLPLRTIAQDPEHVHRVLRPDAEPTAFVFGDAEWQRKARNVWCWQCVRV